jgi:hypothetical protein
MEKKSEDTILKTKNASRKSNLCEGRKSNQAKGFNDAGFEDRLF